MRTMIEQTIKKLTAAADQAIREERFDDLVNYYTEDAVLVIKPGKEAHGREAVKKSLYCHCGVFQQQC